MSGTFRPAVVLMAGRGFGFAVSFAIPIVLVRLLDQTEFGTYKQLFLLHATLFSLAQIGMAESLYYFVPYAPVSAGRYIANAFLTLAMSGAVCLILLATAGPTIAAWMSNPELAPLLPPLGLYLSLMLTTAGLEIIMVASQQYVRAAAWYALSDLARGILLILPVLVLPSLAWLLFGAIAFAVIRCAAAVWHLGREFHTALRPDLDLLRQQLAYALPYQAYVLFEVVQSNFHQYAVSAHYDAATFAVYAVGCLQIPLIELLSGSAANVMMVKMGEELREGRDRVAATLWSNTTRKLATVMFPLATLLLINARDLIVLLFTDTYLPSVPVFMIWTSAMLFAAFPTDGVLRAYAQTRLLVLIAVIRLLLLLACISWFLSALGLEGAVLLTVLTTVLGKVFALASMKRLFRVAFREILPWTTLAGIGAVAAIAGLPALLIQSSVNGSPVANVIATALVYLVSYVGLSWAAGLLRAGERNLVRGWLQKVAAGSF